MACLCCTQTLHGQSEESSNIIHNSIDTSESNTIGSKFVIHGIAAPAIPFFILGSIRGDYFFKPHNGSNHYSFFLSGGASYFTIFWTDMYMYSLKGGMLTGTGKHHFELQAGFGRMYDGTPYNLPSITLGYRLQDVQPDVVIRTGVGFPEALYFSIGYNF